MTTISKIRPFLGPTGLLLVLLRHRSVDDVRYVGATEGLRSGRPAAAPQCFQAWVNGAPKTKVIYHPCTTRSLLMDTAQQLCDDFNLNQKSVDEQRRAAFCARQVCPSSQRTAARDQPRDKRPITNKMHDARPPLSTQAQP
eukprot:599638-Pleurochrysis_carterae.AAC.1